MNLVGKAEGRQETEASRKRRHGPARTFFQWFLDNTDPSADDIAEVPSMSPSGSLPVLYIYSTCYWPHTGQSVFFLSSTSTLPATGHTLDSQSSSCPLHLLYLLLATHWTVSLLPVLYIYSTCYWPHTGQSVFFLSSTSTLPATDHTLDSQSSSCPLHLLYLLLATHWTVNTNGCSGQLNIAQCKELSETDA